MLIGGERILKSRKKKKKTEDREFDLHSDTSPPSLI